MTTIGDAFKRVRDHVIDETEQASDRANDGAIDNVESDFQELRSDD